MKLSDLAPAPGARKFGRRLGRGPGSGRGKTSGKGHKGQSARSGGSKGPGFEGGQQPLIRRVPKRGFKNIFRIEYQIINLKQLNCFDAGAVVNSDLLHRSGMIKSKEERVKVLAVGELQKPLVVSAHRFSGSAVKKIESAGGRVERLG